MKIANNDQKQAFNSSGTISSKVTFPRSRSDSSQQKDSGNHIGDDGATKHKAILLFIRAVQIDLKIIGDR